MMLNQQALSTCMKPRCRLQAVGHLPCVPATSPARPITRRVSMMPLSAVPPEQVPVSADEEAKQAGQPTNPPTQSPPAGSPFGMQATPGSGLAKLLESFEFLAKNRRLITLIVALLDVAFIWLVIKGGKSFFFDGHE